MSFPKLNDSDVTALFYAAKQQNPGKLAKRFSGFCMKWY